MIWSEVETLIENGAHVNVTSVLRYRSGPVVNAIMAVAFVTLGVLVGVYAEKLGAAFNNARYYTAFGQRIYPPVTFTSAELGGLFAAIAVWIWVFVWAAWPTRNRFWERVQPTIVRYMWITGTVLVAAFFLTFIDLYLH